MAIVFTAYDPHANETGPRVPLADALAATLLRTAHGIALESGSRGGTLDGERFWHHEVLQSRAEDAARIVHEALEDLGAWATLYRAPVRWTRTRDLGDRWCDDCLTQLAEIEVTAYDAGAGWSLRLCAACRDAVEAAPERVGAASVTAHPGLTRYEERAA